MHQTAEYFNELTLTNSETQEEYILPHLNIQLKTPLSTDTEYLSFEIKVGVYSLKIKKRKFVTL